MKGDLMVVVDRGAGLMVLSRYGGLGDQVFQEFGVRGYVPEVFGSYSDAAQAVGSYLARYPWFADHRDIRIVREVAGEERRVLDIDGKDGFVLKLDDAEPDDDGVFLRHRDVDPTFYFHLPAATVFASKRAAVEALEYYMREVGAKGIGAYFPVLRRIRIERTKTYEDVRLGA